MFCAYYLAKIRRDKVWLVAGAIRSMEIVVLERALFPGADIFEFFVAPDFVFLFEKFIDQHCSQNAIIWVQKAENRLFRRLKS